MYCLRLVIILIICCNVCSVCWCSNGRLVMLGRLMSGCVSCRLSVMCCWLRCRWCRLRLSVCVVYVMFFCGCCYRNCVCCLMLFLVGLIICCKVGWMLLICIRVCR